MTNLRTWEVSYPDEPTDVTRVMITDQYGTRVIERDDSGWWVDRGPAGTWYHRCDWLALIASFKTLTEVPAPAPDPTSDALDKLRAIDPETRETYLAQLSPEIAEVVRTLLTPSSEGVQ